MDGALFLAESWFDEAHAERRQQLGIPPDCRFKTKIELGWEMIQRVKALTLTGSNPHLLNKTNPLGFQESFIDW